MTSATLNRRVIFGFVLLAIALAVIYPNLQTMRYVLWDDDLLIIDNAILKMGLSDALRSSFTGFYNGDYIPLTLMSYWLDVALAGFNAAFQHTENVFLHFINILLLYLWMRRHVKPPFLLWILVAIFALHPLQVESVAWISERKGVLASFFYLLAMNFADAALSVGRQRFWYGLGYVLSFSLASMTKANGLLIPIWLVLAMRLRGKKLDAAGWSIHSIALLSVLIWSFVRVKAYASAIPQFEEVMLSPQRVVMWPAMILASLGFYARMLLVPKGLSIIYPSFTSVGDWLPEVVIGAMLVCIVVLAMLRSRSREILIWSAFILFTLAPVMNVIPRINFVNDRYIYLPIVGFSMVGGLICGQVYSWAVDRGHVITKSKPVRMVIGLCLLLGLSTIIYQSRERAMVWHDNLALWSDTVKKVPSSSLAFNNLGQAYQENGQLDLAIKSFEHSLSLADRQLANLAINNLATIYSSKEYPKYFDLERARSLLEHGIATVVRPDDSLVLRYNLALIYLQSGDIAAAKTTLADLLVRLEATSNQRYRFLQDRVREIQSKIGAQP